VTIGTALVIIAILYLIDKHHLWKKATVTCLVALAVAIVGFSGYYGWEKYQERRAARTDEHEISAGDIEAGFVDPDKYDLSAGDVDVPNWTVHSTPKGNSTDDVAYAILNPVNADERAKTDAWLWFWFSGCAVVGGPEQPLDRIVYKSDLFNLESYDERWMKDINLLKEVKRALWSARTAECRLPPESKKVKACLDRATGTVDVNPKWAQYLTGCGRSAEMIYLSSETKVKK
jgi:hypothetical protein